MLRKTILKLEVKKMNSLASSNLDFDTHTTSEHELFSRSDPKLKPFEVQAHEMVRADEFIDTTDFKKDWQEPIITVSIRGLFATTEPFTLTVPLSQHILDPLIPKVHFFGSVKELPTTELHPLRTSLDEHIFTASKYLTFDPRRVIIGYSFEEESPPEIIKSSLDEDFVISKTDLVQFHNNLNNPDPERIQVREKTLARAIKIFEKYKDNV